MRLTSVEEKVITVGLPSMLIRFDVFFWGVLMAGALIVGVPVPIVYNVVLDRFIQGLTGAGRHVPVKPFKNVTEG